MYVSLDSVNHQRGIAMLGAMFPSVCHLSSNS